MKPPMPRTIRELLELPAWEYFRESKLGNDLFISDPERAARIHDAAEDGADGSTHAEHIEDWREFADQLRDDCRNYAFRMDDEAEAEILSQEIKTHEGEPGGFSDYSFPERLQSIPMRSIRVYFADGQTLETNINGSEVEITEYYVGNEFNLGRGGDDYVTRAIEVEFLPSDI